MVTKYDYLSTCCNTDYSETRNETQAQVYSTCVQCGQGEYTLTLETKLADVPQEPVQTYIHQEEPVVSTRDKFLAAGFTEEEIDLLIQEGQAE